MILEIIEISTNKVVDIESHPCFKDCGVSIGLGGEIILSQYGYIVGGLDSKDFRVRVQIQKNKNVFKVKKMLVSIVNDFLLFLDDLPLELVYIFLLVLVGLVLYFGSNVLIEFAVNRFSEILKSIFSGIS